MKKISIVIGLLFFNVFIRAAVVENLRCEYLTNPLGVDRLNPRLSWEIKSSDRGDVQLAFRVIVSSSRELLDKDQGDVWDTGRLGSDQSIQVAYPGKSLSSGARYFWKVRIWNSVDKPSDWSQPAFWSWAFQTGIRNQ